MIVNDSFRASGVLWSKSYGGRYMYVVFEDNNDLLIAEESDF